MIGSQRTSTKSRRLTTAGLIAITAATLLMMAWAIFPSAAFASGTVSWTGNGSENNVECKPGESPGFHWVFTAGGAQGNTVTAVSLTVNGGASVPMSGNANGTQWDADVVSGIVVSASATYTGTLGAGNAVLTISHGCARPPDTTTETETTTTPTTTTETETTTTPTTTTETETTTTPTTTTETETTTTPTTTSSTGTTTTSSSSTATVRPTTVEPSETDATVAPTTVRPGGTAFTGVENVVPIGAIALMLMTSGSGLLWAGSRRKRDQSQDDE